MLHIDTAIIMKNSHGFVPQISTTITFQEERYVSD